MKFFPIVLLLFLVLGSLKGLTLSQESPDQKLNTSLLANFNGLYVRKNPCSNEEVETSSYEASHEFHHCNKGQRWTDLTEKCSALISGFLKSVCNLINLNSKHDGTLSLNVNTSISKKPASQQNCKDGKYSLPTIVIKATNYENAEQNEEQKENSLTVDRSKQKAVNDVFRKQRISTEKSFEELSATSRKSSTSNKFRKEDEDDLPVTKIPERPQKTFKRTHIAKPGYFTQTRNFEAAQESENSFKQTRNKYVTEQPGSTTINSNEKTTAQTDDIARLRLGTTEKSKLLSGNQLRNSRFEIQPTGHFGTLPNREKFSSVSQSQAFSNGVGMETSDYILPAPSVTQQSTTPRFSRVPQNDNSNFYLTTVSPINSVNKQEDVEEITEFSEKSESLMASNSQQTVSLNSKMNPTIRPIQPAQSLDYLNKQAGLNTPNIPVDATDIPEYLPTTDRFEQGNVPGRLPYGKKQSDTLSYTPLTSEATPETSNVELGPQTQLDPTQPQPENSFQQNLNYPISEEINQESSYSQRETQLASSEERTELYGDEECNTTLPPENEDPLYVTPPALPVDEFSRQNAGTPGIDLEFPSQEALPSTINEEAGNVYDTQSGSNPSYTRRSHQKTTPVYSTESLVGANQEDDEATIQEPLSSPTTQYEEEVVDQFQSSEQSDSTYAQISESTLDKNQNFPGSPFYGKMENRSPRAQLKPQTVLGKGSTPAMPATSQAMPRSSDRKTMKNLPIRPERQAGGQIENLNGQKKSFKSSQNRPPLTEQTTDADLLTYSSQKKVSSFEKESELTESSTMQASQGKPNLYSSHIPKYGSPMPSKDAPFVSDSSPTSNTVKNDPLPLILTPKDTFPESAAKTAGNINSSAESKSFTLKPVDYKKSPSLPEFQQPLRTSTNNPDRNQFPTVIQSQSRATEQFSEIATDSSNVYSRQTSAKVPVSASQNAEAKTSYNDRQDSLLIMDSKSEKASASEESFSLNENKAETFSEGNQYDNIASSQDAKTQLPQPQPSFDYFDYSGQLSRNERESNTASTDLQTSKTFEGSKPNIQPLLTFSPLPSVPAKTNTFTTESGDLANEYLDEPKPIASALEEAQTTSPFPAQNTETIITEVSEVYSTPPYNGRFVPTTPSPPLTTFTSLPAQEKYLVSDAFVQDIPITPQPQSINPVQYDQEIITVDSQPTPSPSPVALLPVKYSGQFLDNKNEQDFGGSNLAATQFTEDRLDRFDDKVTSSESVLKNTNRDMRNGRLIQASNANEKFEATSTALTEKKQSFKQLPARGMTLPLLNNDSNGLLKTETNSRNVDLTTARPVPTETTFDEVTATDSSNSLSSFMQASTMSPPERLSNRPFDDQRRHLPNPTISQFSRQFHPENRPLYHPHPGFSSQHQFENRPHGNYPHPMDFNPQAPRPRFNHFDDFAREQHNQYPTGFQYNQFESRFPDQFQPGLDRFMVPGHPSNYGGRYFPDGRPNFHPDQHPRSGMNSESFSSTPVPPNFNSFQHPDVSEKMNFQHRPHETQERSAEENFNSRGHYAQNFLPYSYRPRNDFNERFGSNYPFFEPKPRDRFHPDQIPYNQMMPPYTYYPAGNFNPYGPPFLNNSNQQVEDRYQPNAYDHRAKQMDQKTDRDQAPPEVLDDYKKALTGLASGERLVKFDEEVTTINPEKGSNFETTAVTEELEQRQDEATTASYNLREHDVIKPGSLHEFNNVAASGQTSDVFRSQNRHLSGSSQNHPMPFPQSVDSFGPQRPNSLPNSSNQFMSVSSDFQRQSNANFASSHILNGGSMVGSNPSQSDSHALGPQIFPSSTPGKER